MAAHQTISDRNCHTIDLSSYAATARGVDGPKGVSICMVYAPAGSVCFVQSGDVTDASTNISTDGMPIPPEQWCGFPCGVGDADGPSTRQPSVFLQGSANVTIRFVDNGIG